jgi:hypothetical protein
VFNISDSNYGYTDAQAVCKLYGATLATYDQIEEAYNNGAEWCNYGWSDGQMAYYPTQKSTWDDLQDIPGHQNDCGRPGINGGYIENPYLQFGINCYGVKPSETDLDQTAIEQNNSCYSKNMNANVPQTQEEKELEKKVYYWQKNKDKITIGGYNKDKWSEY